MASSHEPAAVARAGGVWVRFEDAARIVTFHWHDADAMTPEAADVLIPHVAAWSRSFEGPYGFLVDGSTSYGTSPGGQGWFARWAAFQRQEPKRARVAVYRAGPFLRGRLLLYNSEAQTPLQLFDSEREARAWLAGELFPRGG